MGVWIDRTACDADKPLRDQLKHGSWNVSSVQCRRACYDMRRRYLAMIDSTTQARITVSTDGDAAPYIMVPLYQLEAVKDVLRNQRIYFWVDSDAISLHGKPEIAVVNLGRDADVGQVQHLLDAAA
jgi:hypothetical protein